MIEINLIPDVKRELLRAQRARAMVISGSIITSIAALSIVVLLVLYIYGVQTVRGLALDSAIESGNKTLSQVDDLSKMLTIQNQLSKVSTLNDQKNIDSRLFDVLAAVIPPAPNEVRMSQVTINSEDGTIRLEGQTRGYDSMEVFKKTLDSAIVNYAEGEQAQTEKLATGIDVADATFAENAENQRILRFTLTFKYAEKLFASTVSNVGIKLSINGNVTDSYLGIPKTIFTEKAKDL